MVDDYTAKMTELIELMRMIGKSTDKTIKRTTAPMTTVTSGSMTLLTRCTAESTSMS